MQTNEYIFIDTETTGMRPNVDRIIDIAFFHVANNQIVSEWHQLINPEIHIPATIQGLTGINNEMVASAPNFADIAPIIAPKLNNNLLVAHNARFDYAFLKNEMKRTGITFRAKTLCTLKL